MAEAFERYEVIKEVDYSDYKIPADTVPESFRGAMVSPSSRPTIVN
jgi:hypothetical protein